MLIFGRVPRFDRILVAELQKFLRHILTAAVHDERSGQGVKS